MAQYPAAMHNKLNSTFAILNGIIKIPPEYKLNF